MLTQCAVDLLVPLDEDGHGARVLAEGAGGNFWASGRPGNH